MIVFGKKGFKGKYTRVDKEENYNVLILLKEKFKSKYS